jgi:hypothetical protein
MEKKKQNSLLFGNISFANLKTAYAFVHEDIHDLEKAAENKGIAPENIPAYPEVTQIKHDLYHALLNKTRDLYTK